MHVHTWPLVTLKDRKVGKSHVLWNLKLWTKARNLQQPDGKRNLWRRKGAAHDLKRTTACVKHEGGGVMVWACVAASGRGSLVWPLTEVTKWLAFWRQRNGEKSGSISTQWRMMFSYWRQTRRQKGGCREGLTEQTWLWLTAMDSTLQTPSTAEDFIQILKMMDTFTIMSLSPDTFESLKMEVLFLKRLWFLHGNCRVGEDLWNESSKSTLWSHLAAAWRQNPKNSVIVQIYNCNHLKVWEHVRSAAAQQRQTNRDCKRKKDFWDPRE